MKYAVLYEQTPNNFAAYVPDLPGCVATGRDRAEVERHIGEAILLHLELMRESGEPVPPATSEVGTVEIRSPDRELMRSSRP